MEKIIRIVQRVRSLGFSQTMQGYYMLIYSIILRKVFKKKFIERNIHNYKMKLSIDDKGISNALLRYGTREEDQLAIIRQELKPGMRVLDLGANIGYYALLLQSIVGEKGKVYAIEPASENFYQLVENIKLNEKEDHIEYYHAGISNKVCTDTLYLSEHSNIHGFFKNTRMMKINEYSAEALTEQITMTTIDEFTKDKMPIHFIRMDTEGFEVKAFQGMHEFVNRSEHTIKILFEVHRSRYDDNEFNMRKELTWLFDEGFIPKILIAKPLTANKPWPVTVFSDRKHKPKMIVRADGRERGWYEDLPRNDVLEFVCNYGCVRALFLERSNKT